MNKSQIKISVPDVLRTLHFCKQCECTWVHGRLLEYFRTNVGPRAWEAFVIAATLNDKVLAQAAIRKMRSSTTLRERWDINGIKPGRFKACETAYMLRLVKDATNNQSFKDVKLSRVTTGEVTFMTVRR